ncbi:hypothetical protein KIPB_010918 [Kipferlia bialata]|uniref:Uncharacterized protein n=1 Tax=Kipferlia bialata TaxID=797122 RepID=A0A9K3D782_9EUKA|nr:hypothetical protein KIPB_010918 [Kipferlia bialata]|eukprot:g10918.t1
MAPLSSAVPTTSIPSIPSIPSTAKGVEGERERGGDMSLGLDLGIGMDMDMGMDPYGLPSFPYPPGEVPSFHHSLLSSPAQRDRERERQRERERRSSLSLSANHTHKAGYDRQGEREMYTLPSVGSYAQEYRQQRVTRMNAQTSGDYSRPTMPDNHFLTCETSHDSPLHSHDSPLHRDVDPDHPSISDTRVSLIEANRSDDEGEGERERERETEREERSTYHLDPQSDDRLLSTLSVTHRERESGGAPHYARAAPTQTARRLPRSALHERVHQIKREKERERHRDTEAPARHRDRETGDVNITWFGIPTDSRISHGSSGYSARFQRQRSQLL